MITSFAELEESTKRIAEQLPFASSEVLLTEQGISADEKARLLAAIPDLPQSYLKCAERYRLCGFFSGYFAFWPAPFGNDLVESVIVANSASNPHFQHFTRLRLAAIGFLEAAPLAIALKVAHVPEGTVMLFNPGRPLDEGEALAPDFETFMLLAGSLYHVSYLEKEDRHPFEVFRSGFRAWPGLEPYWAAWKKIAEEVTDFRGDS